MRIGVLIIVLFVLCSFLPYGTSYTDDYAKIVSAYKAKKALSFSVHYKSFDKSTTTPDTVITGKYQIEGSKYCVRIAGTEAIRNDKYYLAVDHNNKIIFLNKASAVPGDFYPMSTIDTLMKKKLIDISGEDINEGKSRRYTITNKSKTDLAYKKAIWEFDVNSYLIKKVTITLPARENLYKEPNWQYIDEPFVEFNYTTYSFVDIDDNVFSIDKYVSIHDNGLKVEVKEAYKKYRMVNSILIGQQIR